jgi:hypothetical protein
MDANIVTPEVARDFRLQLQQAREDALKDAEAFDGILHAVERLGSFCLGRVESLYKYGDKLLELANLSPLATEISTVWREVHTPFDVLYGIVKAGRNDAMHIGAAARHLTIHAIELALILEDALRMCEDSKCVSDYMIRDPVCAHLWQPISFIRQRMLSNSFSFMPVKDRDGRWCLVSDLGIAKYLQGYSNQERKRRLATPLADADEIPLLSAKCVGGQQTLSSLLADFDGTPILVLRDSAPFELAGILTAFDLL